MKFNTGRENYNIITNITNDYNSLRHERDIIVRQQHRKDSSCQLLRFFKENLAF